jgi:WD40 repeat protein
MTDREHGVFLQATLSRGHLGRIIDVAWSPDGTRIASSSFDGTIRLWSPGVSQAPLLPPFDPDAGIVYSVAWEPTGPRLASAYEDGSVRLWDTEASGAPLALDPFDKRASCVAWAPDGGTLASGCGDKRIYLWRRTADGWRYREPLNGHSKGVANVSWSPNGLRLASASYDRSVRVWDCLSGDELHRFGSIETAWPMSPGLRMGHRLPLWTTRARSWCGARPDPTR